MKRILINPFVKNNNNENYVNNPFAKKNNNEIINSNPGGLNLDSIKKIQSKKIILRKNRVVLLILIN